MSGQHRLCAAVACMLYGRIMHPQPDLQHDISGAESPLFVQLHMNPVTKGRSYMNGNAIVGSTTFATRQMSPFCCADLCALWLSFRSHKGTRHKSFFYATGKGDLGVLCLIRRRVVRSSCTLPIQGSISTCRFL